MEFGVIDSIGKLKDFYQRSCWVLELFVTIPTEFIRFLSMDFRIILF